MRRRQNAAVLIPLWFKIAYTAFVLVILAVWYVHYGLPNFLWFSDIALIGAVPAMWFENALLSSVLAVAVLLPELLWNVDLALRAVLRRRITGLTDYMFEHDRLLKLRLLSLFHVPLPFVLLWLLASYGYVDAGLMGAILLTVVVLPVSRLVGTPQRNINWVYGLGSKPQPVRGWGYVALLTAGMIVVLFVPTHLLLRVAFG
ncbi:MAG TPA: hypothetical protein VLT59_10690 [Steroidobacteraceae bacterium]|nr:hypothetical protein [Steroidobacteraceae bacterium]